MLFYLIILICLLIYLDAFRELLWSRKRLKMLEARLAEDDEATNALLQMEKESKINMYWWIWSAINVIALLVLGYFIVYPYFYNPPINRVSCGSAIFNTPNCLYRDTLYYQGHHPIQKYKHILFVEFLMDNNPCEIQ